MEQFRLQAKYPDVDTWRADFPVIPGLALLTVNGTAAPEFWTGIRQRHFV